MKKILILILPLILTSCIETIAVAGFGSAYLMTRTKPVKNSLTDVKITTKLTKEIKYSKEKKLYKKLNFNVYQGRVLLTGNINEQQDLTQLTEKIWSIKGVSELINETSVKSTNKHSVLTDHYIASKIKTRFILDKNIKAFNINVEVYNQNAYLIGNVANEADVKIAAKSAAKVRGVKKVVSFLRSS